MRVKVAIVGTGRMGGLLAARLPAACRKVIIGRHREQAVALADEVGGIAADQLSAVRGCSMVFLAVPGPSIDQVLQNMEAHLDPGSLVVNMATDVPTADLASAHPNVRMAAAKVIGHALEMAAGSPGAVVLDHVDPDDEPSLRSLLEGLGPVVRDDESKVLAASTIVIEGMAAAEVALRQRLAALGLDEVQILAAIRTLGPGILRSLSNGTLGPFARKIIAKMSPSEGAGVQLL